jgi:hypothetical protein
MKSYLLSTFILASLALLATTNPIPDSHPVHIESRAGEDPKLVEKYGLKTAQAIARAQAREKALAHPQAGGTKGLMALGALEVSTHSGKEGVSNKSPSVSAILIYNILDRCLCRELRGLVMRQTARRARKATKKKMILDER